MSVQQRICGACGKVNSSDSLFCGGCGASLAGAPLEEPAVPSSQNAPASSVDGTVHGVALADLPGEPRPNAAAAVAPKAGRRAPQNSTMVGMPIAARDARSGAAGAVTPSAQAALPEPAPQSQHGPPTHDSTMVGMPVMNHPSGASSGVGDPLNAPSPSTAKRAKNGTLVGPAVAPRQPEPSAEPVLSGGAPQPESKKPIVGPSNRTMLGVAAPAEAVANARAANALAAGEEEASASYESEPDDLSIAGLPSPHRGRSRVVWFGLVGLILALGGVAIFLMTSGGGSAPIGVSMIQAEGSELLEIQVPDAPPGASVRFNGTEQVLDDGKARFAVSSETLHVGNNTIGVEVVHADGTVDHHQVTLTLELRVRADLGTLDSEPPAITVQVEALAGSTATLDGRPLELDSAGRGSKAYPIAAIEPSEDGQLQLRVPWTVRPPDGEQAEGTLSARVPRASLQIERPSEHVITDRPRVTISGALALESSLTIDGQSVTVNEGHFEHTQPLSLGDNEIHIVARAHGRAPAERVLSIRRVSDLAREAQQYQVERGLDYRAMVADPAAHRDQRIALEGQVYNVSTQGGNGVLQMLVTDCPASERCPLWVTYGAVTEVETGSTVRVLGTVAGEQQFRSESGQIRTVPRVDAVFVLPLRR